MKKITSLFELIKALLKENNNRQIYIFNFVDKKKGFT